MERAATLRAAVAVLPASCYDNPTWKGVLYFVRDLAMYAAAVALLASTDHWLALALLWPLTGLCIGTLFLLGHDAAHGALFRHPRLCRIVGTVALMPSLHAYAVWALGHNRIHHVHAGAQDADFVWHPLSRVQYAALPPLQRLRHRIEWSAAGAGLYYLRVIWWDKMVRLTPPARFATAFLVDRLVVLAYALISSAACVGLGYSLSGHFAGALWMWTKLWLGPWICWNYFIGATVYLHHIAPEALWFRRAEWTRFRGQVLATTNYVAPRWYNVFAHNVYLHAPHHVDPRIPFYGLPAAHAALSAHFTNFIATRPLRLRDYVATTRRCKLYDFDRRVWCGYDGEVVAAAAAACRDATTDQSCALDSSPARSIGSQIAS